MIVEGLSDALAVAAIALALAGAEPAVVAIPVIALVVWTVLFLVMMADNGTAEELP